MTKETMIRHASDNKYLHKDFHGALSAAIDYVDQKYGADAVREFIRRFAASYYATLMQDIGNRGLVAIKEHFERIYEIEGGKIEISISEDELILKVNSCPAVMHMRDSGYPVAKLFHETSATLNETLCQGTPFASELVEYDQLTGKSVQRFYRRES